MILSDLGGLCYRKQGHAPWDRQLNCKPMLRRYVKTRSAVWNILRRALSVESAQSERKCSPVCLLSNNVSSVQDDIIALEKVRMRQSDEHWNCFKGKVGETSERWGGAHNYGLFRAPWYHLEQNRIDVIRLQAHWVIFSSDCADSTESALLSDCVSDCTTCFHVLST